VQAHWHGYNTYSIGSPLVYFQRMPSGPPIPFLDHPSVQPFPLHHAAQTILAGTNWFRYSRTIPLSVLLQAISPKIHLYVSDETNPSWNQKYSCRTDLSPDISHKYPSYPYFWPSVQCTSLCRHIPRFQKY